jgi:hypothetical protein
MATGGMPDYGSPYLTDFAFIAAVGAHSGMATINVALGHQTVHASNFGRAEFGELSIALQGAHRYLGEQLRGRDDWPAIQMLMEAFLGRWTIDHGTFLYRHLDADPARRRQLQEVMREILRLAYMRHFRARYYAKIHLPRMIQSLLRGLLRWVRSAKAFFLPASTP